MATAYRKLNPGSQRSELTFTPAGASPTYDIPAYVRVDQEGNPNPAVTVTGQPNLVGTWSYYAGVSGTVTVAAGQRVIGIGAHSTVGGSCTIGGGSAIPIPANVGIGIRPEGNLVAPTIVFTGTDSYVVEVLQ